MFINEKLQVEEYFYPLAEQNNPIFQSIISSVKKRNFARCHAQMTDWNFRSKEIDELVFWITNKAQNNMVNPYVKISTSYSLSCSDAWGLVCNQGDYLEDHRHDPSMFSFVYYVNSPKGSSPLVFRTSGYEVNPEAGKVVIFNSRLLHEIPPNNCNGRYSFVGNLSAV